ncbi:MAG: putative RND superfamily exporter protein [Pseudohongiellaceae bacterium]
MTTFVKAWARAVIAWRLPIIIATVLLIPAMLFTGGPIPFDNSTERYFVAGDPTLIEFDKLEEYFGDNEYLLIGFEAAAGDVFQTDTLDAINRMTEFLDFHPYVTQLRSITNFQYIHADGDDLRTDYLIEDIEDVIGNEAAIAEIKNTLLSEKLALGTLITEDFRHVRIAARVEYREETSEHKIELVQDLYEFVKSENFESDQYILHLSGYPLVNERFETVTAEDIGVLIPIMIALMAAILFISFRSLAATLFPWLAIASSLLIVLELQYYLKIPHSTIDSAALIPTLIIIGIGITVHVLIDFFRYRNTGENSIESALKTIEHVWVPAFFTAITTSAGFIALSITKIMPIREFALLGAIGPLVLFIFSLTALPAMLSYLGKLSDKTKNILDAGFISKLTQHIPDFTLQRRNPILALSMMALIFSILYLPSIKVDTNYVSLFKESSQTRQDIVYFDEAFRGMMTLDIILDSGEYDGVKHPEFLAKMESMQDWLSEREALGPINSLIDYLKEINQSLHGDDSTYYRIPDSSAMTAQYLLLYESSGANEDLSDIKDFDNQMARLVVPVVNMRASAMKAELDTINEYLLSNFGELDPIVTGTMALATVQDVYVSDGMVQSFLIALTVITAFFIALFRSFKYGLLSIIPSILPIILAGSVAGFLGVFMDLSAVIVFAMTMGIAVDDAIHVMSRYLLAKEQGANTHDAIQRAMNESGRAVVFSSIVLVSGFSVLCFASFTTVIYVGLFGAIIMSLALLGDLLVLPAILYLVDGHSDRSQDSGLSEIDSGSNLDKYLF